MTDNLELTKNNLKRTIITLTIINILSVWFSKSLNTSGWIVVFYTFFLLFCGFVGAVRHNRYLLNFYWVAQTVNLILTVGGIVFSLLVLLMDMKKKSSDQIDIHDLTKQEMIYFIIMNLLNLLCFLVVLTLKARSIILSQQLSKFIFDQSKSAEESKMFELEKGIKEDEEIPLTEELMEEAKPEPLRQAQQSPQQMFYFVQPQFYNQPQDTNNSTQMHPYPMPLNNGFPQMIPIYVDQYGNPIQPTQNSCDM